jgi:hypothetical protein
MNIYNFNSCMEKWKYNGLTLGDNSNRPIFLNLRSLAHPDCIIYDNLNTGGTCFLIRALL